METLVKLQAESGLWHTLLNDETSYEESSASANFAYGIMKGVRLGLLDKKYNECAYKAINALYGCVDENGTVDKCSYGTGMGETLEFYKEIPICPMPYGQTLSILAFIEYIKSNETER